MSGSTSTIRFPEAAWFARHRTRRRRQVGDGLGPAIDMGLGDPSFRRCVELLMMGDEEAAEELEFLARLQS